jgi:arylamine N-acetyltransferase
MCFHDEMLSLYQAHEEQYLYREQFEKHLSYHYNNSQIYHSQLEVAQKYKQLLNYRFSINLELIVKPKLLLDYAL